MMKDIERRLMRKNLDALEWAGQDEVLLAEVQDSMKKLSRDFWLAQLVYVLQKTHHCSIRPELSDLLEISRKKIDHLLNDYQQEYETVEEIVSAFNELKSA